MSQVALQRVLVRMLYDPRFCAKVMASPEHTLRDVSLSARERRWLAEADPRAWQLDPLRRTRTLQALLEEYPLTAALVVQQSRCTRLLDKYFESSAFHQAIQNRQSLSLSFGEALPMLLHGLPCSVLAMTIIEFAIARKRRAAFPVGSESDTSLESLPMGVLEQHRAGTFTLSPAIEVLSAPKGSLELYGKLFALVRQHPKGILPGLLEAETWKFTVPILEPGTMEWIMVDASNLRTGPSLSECPDELAELLAGCRRPTTMEDLSKTLGRLGINSGEEAELIEDLLRDGLLMAVPQ
jgi:hypothetical protein